MLRTRLSTAAIALPALLAVVIFAPAGVFSVFIALLAFWSLYEVGAMTRATAPQIAILGLCGAIPTVVLLYFKSGWLGLPAIVIVLMGVLIARVGISGAGSLRVGGWQVLLGALWVGMLFPYFALLRNSRDGVALTIMMLLLVVASDSGAYFVGRAFGRHKLIPNVSPNKTIEGAIGGLAASLIVGLGLGRWMTPGLTIGPLTIFALCVSLLAQFGDLANSAFKRVAAVKDSGWLFPGHGGLLDRACSLVFAVVFTYYYFRSLAVG